MSRQELIAKMEMLSADDYNMIVMLYLLAMSCLIVRKLSLHLPNNHWYIFLNCYNIFIYFFIRWSI